MFVDVCASIYFNFFFSFFGHLGLKILIFYLNSSFAVVFLYGVKEYCLEIHHGEEGLFGMLRSRSFSSDLSSMCMSALLTSDDLYICACLIPMEIRRGQWIP